MKCYAHESNDAVGTCAACGRGVCRECAADMGRALACNDRCEPEVRRLLDLRDFNFSQTHITIEAHRGTKRGLIIAGLMFVGFGLLIISVGYQKGNQIAAWFGAGMIALGIAIAWGSRWTPRTDQFRLCHGCGYNLTGNTTGKCPECGFLA